MRPCQLWIHPWSYHSGHSDKGCDPRVSFPFYCCVLGLPIGNKDRKPELQTIQGYPRIEGVEDVLLHQSSQGDHDRIDNAVHRQVQKLQAATNELLKATDPQGEKENMKKQRPCFNPKLGLIDVNWFRLEFLFLISVFYLWQSALRIVWPPKVRGWDGLQRGFKGWFSIAMLNSWRVTHQMSPSLAERTINTNW